MPYLSPLPVGIQVGIRSLDVSVLVALLLSVTIGFASRRSSGRICELVGAWRRLSVREQLVKMLLKVIAIIYHTSVVVVLLYPWG